MRKAPMYMYERIPMYSEAEKIEKRVFSVRIRARTDKPVYNGIEDIVGICRSL